MSDFLAYALKSIFQVSFTELKAIFDKTPNEFDTFEDVMKMYEGGINLPGGSVLRKIRDMIPFEMIRELIRTDNERLFKFPTPQVIQSTFIIHANSWFFYFTHIWLVTYATKSKAS